MLYWILSTSLVTQKTVEENAITKFQARNVGCFFCPFIITKTTLTVVKLPLNVTKLHWLNLN